jgi:isoamylase
MLRCGSFLTGEFNEELQLSEVKWMSWQAWRAPGQWTDSLMKCFGILIDDRPEASGIRKPASDATLDHRGTQPGNDAQSAATRSRSTP